MAALMQGKPSLIVNETILIVPDPGSYGLKCFWEGHMVLQYLFPAISWQRKGKPTFIVNETILIVQDPGNISLNYFWEGHWVYNTCSQTFRGCAQALKAKVNRHLL